MKYDSGEYLEGKSISWLEARLKEDRDREIQKEIAQALIEKVENSSTSISLSTIITAFNYYNMQEVLEKSETSPNSFISLGAHLNMVNRMSNTKHSEFFEHRQVVKECQKQKKNKKQKKERYYDKY